MSDRVLRGKGKPFPYNEKAADSPDDFMWEKPAAGRRGRRPLQRNAANSPNVAFIQSALTPSLPQRGIGVKLTITGDFKQSKQQKQAKSKDVFALKKH
ncbi:MAG: hypothetical protein IJF88_08945, partial [Oscillospiraceae bacterium]|nr:hypothetical protein [Oscillospiraceae bacterium]